MQETQTRVDIDALELDLMMSYLPEKLTLHHKCDKCGAHAHHAWVVPTAGGGYTTLTFCNHHGREVRDSLEPYPHKDYRMTVEEAAAIDAKALAAATAPSAPVNAEFRAVPRHLTQWDARYWA